MTDFVGAMGIEAFADPHDPGVWHARCPIEDKHLQPYGVVHGGVYAAIAETVASIGTATAVMPNGDIAMGQSNHTLFLAAVGEGVIDATARPVHRGRTTWVWEVDVTVAERRVARSTITMAVRPQRG